MTFLQGAGQTHEKKQKIAGNVVYVIPRLPLALLTRNLNCFILTVNVIPRPPLAPPARNLNLIKVNQKPFFSS